MCSHEAFQAAAAPRPAAAFADRMIGALNEGALCMMTSVGHRTGLFDTMAELPPATSEEIAREAKLNERYVREWLGAMTTARVVDYDAATRRYHLPKQNAAFVTRRAAADNLAAITQYFAVMGAVEDDVVACFREGGGVPYQKYRRFHEVMAEDSGQSVLSSLFSHILPLVAGLTERLERGIRVLDLGCGRGLALIMMAERFPASSFLGYDLSREAIAYGREQARRKGLRNVRLEARDLSDFDQKAAPEAFDLVTTFDAVHDQARPRALLAGIRRTLAPDGVYLMQDIHGSSELQNNLEHPVGTLLYAISTMHCLTVSLAQGGDGLGTMWGRETAQRLLAEAGFGQMEIHRLEHDFQNDYYVVRK